MSTATPQQTLRHPSDYLWRIVWVENDGTRRHSICWYATLDECSAAAHALSNGRTFNFERRPKEAE